MSYYSDITLANDMANWVRDGKSCLTCGQERWGNCPYERGHAKPFVGGKNICHKYIDRY